MVTADQAAKLGAWGVMASMQPNFDALWGGRDGMYARRLGIDRAGRLNPFALLASQGVALAFGSDAPVTGLDPWATIRAAVNHHTPDSSISARAAFAAATRGGWRAGGAGDGLIGSLVPGAPASYAVWDVDEFDVQRAERRRAAVVDRSAVAGAGVAAARPDRPVAPLPADRAPRRSDSWLEASGGSTAESGPLKTPTSSRRSETTTAPDEIPVPAAAADAEVTGVIPAGDVDDDEDADVAISNRRTTMLSADPHRPTGGATRPGRPGRQVVWQRLVYLSAVLLAWLVRETRIRVPQAGSWLRPRLTRLSAAILAGLLLCSSYPRFNWWWAAVLAFAVLSWVLTRPATTPVGGFGYGFLFGLAFYLPLIRWISILVGAMPLLALVLLCAVFPGLFGLAAVVVRRLPGWPIWFAVLWAAQEWLKSTVPIRRLPVGRGGRRSDRPARSCRWSGWAASRCCRWRSC